MTIDATITSESAERFAAGVRQPRSPVLDAREAMRQRMLARTAQWLAARGISRIALFGAGRHTRPIVRQPWVSEGVRVEVILDDAPRTSVLGGVRVAKAGEGPLPVGVGAIVISSEAYEQALYERAAALYGGTGVPIIRLYSGGDDAYEFDATVERLSRVEGLSAADARWLVENRGERHDATLPMLPPARTELHLRRYELAAERLAARGGGAVADLACGTGYGASVMSLAATRYEGVDIDERAVAYARTRHGGAARAFHVADAAHTPLPGASFDMVASFETIEHVRDTASLVAEYARVLKPKGLLIVSTPNKLGPTPHHVHDFGLPEFTAALAPRFEVIEMLAQLPVDDVFAEDLPPGMWRIEQGDGPLTPPDGSGRRADFLIAIARHRTSLHHAPRGTHAADEVDVFCDVASKEPDVMYAASSCQTRGTR